MVGEKSLEVARDIVRGSRRQLCITLSWAGYSGGGGGEKGKLAQIVSIEEVK